MPYLMGGTICQSEDQTDYCRFTRGFHMLTMVLTILFAIDFLLGGHILRWGARKWQNNFQKK